MMKPTLWKTMWRKSRSATSNRSDGRTDTYKPQKRLTSPALRRFLGGSGCIDRQLEAALQRRVGETPNASNSACPFDLRGLAAEFGPNSEVQLRLHLPRLATSVIATDADSGIRLRAPVYETYATRVC